MFMVCSLGKPATTDIRVRCLNFLHALRFGGSMPAPGLTADHLCATEEEGPALRASPGTHNPQERDSDGQLNSGPRLDPSSRDTFKNSLLTQLVGDSSADPLCMFLFNLMTALDGILKTQTQTYKECLRLPVCGAFLIFLRGENC